jgi:hypothetical protein
MRVQCSFTFLRVVQCNLNPIGANTRCTASFPSYLSPRPIKRTIGRAGEDEDENFYIAFKID